MTDRSGRIVLKPGFADGLVILRLLAANVEPVAEFPVMPGESSEERQIPFDPRYQSVALAAQVDSLRDQVVDLVALRARLEARMKARLEGEDWAGLEDAIKEFSHLTPRDEYAKKLAELKEHATQEQAETKKAILTKNAQAQINDVQAMIDRYLDDETFKAYQDALARGKLEAGDKAKAWRRRRPRRRKSQRSRESLRSPGPSRRPQGRPRSRPSPSRTRLPPPGPSIPF